MYDYVSGTVNVDGDAVSFIRITNIKDVIESTLRTLHKNKHMVQHGNVPSNEAWVVLEADKGSSGTTLGLQVLNRQVYLCYCAHILVLACFVCCSVMKLCCPTHVHDQLTYMSCITVCLCLAYTLCETSYSTCIL